MADAPAPPRRRPLALRWAIAVISVAVAAALTTGPGGERLFPEPPERFVHAVTLLYAAGVLSAWLGGMGPGALAALLAALVVDWFITPPLYAITLDFDFLLRIAVFTLSALLVGWLSSRRRRTEDALRHSRDELELRVQARTADLSDCNARLQAEIAARARVEETLRDQAALLDLTHDTVFVRDGQDVITYWNRGAEQLYGWTKSEAIGAVAHTRMRTVFPAPLPDIMAELTRTGRWEGELVHTRRDGTPVVVASRWSLRRGGPDRVPAILETNNDVTERKHAEDALHQAQTELARVTRVTTLGELAASIAHEVNQPLAAIVADASACLHWLDAVPPPLDQVRGALTAIVGDGDRAAEVLTRIRALLARSPVARQPGRLADVIADVLPPRPRRAASSRDHPPGVPGREHAGGRGRSHPAPAGAHQPAGQRVRGHARRRGRAAAARHPRHARSHRGPRLGGRHDRGRGRRPAGAPGRSPLRAVLLDQAGRPRHGSVDQPLHHREPRRPPLGHREPRARRHVPPRAPGRRLLTPPPRLGPGRTCRPCERRAFPLAQHGTHRRDARTVTRSVAEMAGGFAVIAAVGVLINIAVPVTCHNPSTCPTSCARVHGEPSAEITHAGCAFGWDAQPASCVVPLCTRLTQ